MTDCAAGIEALVGEGFEYGRPVRRPCCKKGLVSHFCVRDAVCMEVRFDPNIPSLASRCERSMNAGTRLDIWKTMVMALLPRTTISLLLSPGQHTAAPLSALLQRFQTYSGFFDLATCPLRTA